MRKSICEHCLPDKFLRAELLSRNVAGKCNYCGREAILLPIEELVQKIDEIFRENFCEGEELPIFSDDSDNPDYEIQGEDMESVIYSIIDLPETATKDVVDGLIESDFTDIRDGGAAFYDETMNYEEVREHTSEHQSQWFRFRNIVRFSERYFNSEVRDILDDLFSDIRSYRIKQSRSPVYLLSPSDSKLEFIFRARKANSLPDRKKILENPESELAAPPFRLAVDGRMNSRGIPVFYGALDEATALEEIGLSVGEFAVSGKFRVVEPLKVLDLTRLSEIWTSLSYFDPKFRSKLSRLRFLRTFEEQISRPIAPQDTSLNYLPTQVLAEYLFQVSPLELDAVVYSSSQSSKKGKNIAIKHGSSLVKKEDKVLAGSEEVTEIWDDDFDHYFLRRKEKWTHSNSMFEHDGPDKFERAKPRLELVATDLKVHELLRKESTLRTKVFQRDQDSIEETRL